MRTCKQLICCTLLLFLLPLGGCAEKPVVSDFWLDEAFDGQRYGNILVIGAAEKITFRNIFEDEFVKQLGSKGIYATPSYHILPYNNMLTRELVLSAVDQYDIDSVLITSLVQRSKIKTFYTTRYNNPYEFYKQTYYTIREPNKLGAYETDFLILKTNLYDVNTEKLIWSITSDSKIMYKIKSLKSIISLIISKLDKDGLI